MNRKKLDFHFASYLKTHLYVVVLSVQMICFCNSNEILYVSVAQILLEMQKCMNIAISNFHINVKNWGIFTQRVTLTLIELQICTKLIVILEKVILYIIWTNI